jgi:2,3-diketo-5-methylthio-1-phosphopentane phosphatase
MQENKNEKKAEKKILLVFDLDNTILSQTTDYEVLKLISESDLGQIRESSANWAKFMQEVYKKMKEQSIDLSQIKSVVERIPMNEGFKELFALIRENKEKFETLIVSGANTLYIKWILDCHQLHGVVDGVFANPAEPHDDLLIKIRPLHEDHKCKTCVCDLAQCKKLALLDYFASKGIDDFQESYNNLVYVGDGENDFCPSTILCKQHHLFPRECFDLYNMLYRGTARNKLKCNITPWTNGFKIAEVIKKLI